MPAVGGAAGSPEGGAGGLEMVLAAGMGPAMAATALLAVRAAETEAGGGGAGDEAETGAGLLRAPALDVWRKSGR
jgi:hypothetical protein